MRKYLRFLTAASLAGLSSLAVAADVVVDNQAIPGSEIQSIMISPNTGSIFVTTTTGYTVTSDGGGTGSGNTVAVTSFISNTDSISAGNIVTLSWATVNATSCTPAGGSGGWLNKNISVPTGSTNVTMNFEGSYDFVINCVGQTAADTTSASTTVTVVPVGTVSIASFTATPNSLQVGQSSTIAWTVDNAASCTASGGTGGWAGSNITLPSGSMDVSFSSEGNFNFVLDCIDSSANSVSGNVTVTANPTTNRCGATPLSGSTVAWEDFWLEPFPGPTYSNRYASIPQTGYKALKFNTGSVVDNGKFSTIETTQTIGVRLGAYSKCPGDFDVAPECKYVWGLSGGLRWATDGRAGACQLEPNTTYYLNITFTDGSDPQSTTCKSSPCVTAYQHENF